MPEHVLSLSYGKDSLVLEDEGFLKVGEVFHWKQLDEDPQFRLF